MLFEETIAAIATPAGKGGVGIVRLSGKDPLSVASAMFTPSGKISVKDFSPYRLYNSMQRTKNKCLRLVPERSMNSLYRL